MQSHFVIPSHLRDVEARKHVVVGTINFQNRVLP